MTNVVVKTLTQSSQNLQSFNMITEKNLLLKDSNAFCMLPFVHISTTPNGDAFPCCNASNSIPMGNTNQQTIAEIVNSAGMKKLRIDMLNNTLSEQCSVCHQHEANGIGSTRQNSNVDFNKHFDEAVLGNIEHDGTLKQFKMRHFDIRFSNICNFKCRTCSPEFSSKWEQEFTKLWPGTPNFNRTNRGTALIQELIQHVPYLDIAYFAGGEPLVTEEHYILLEEMIRQNRTDIAIRYSTNLSNLKFKDKNLIELWKYFPSIYLAVSLDHCGPRAEYIRSGTNWETELENIRTVRKIQSIKFSINTVVSIYNYPTLDEFYYHLIDNDILKSTDMEYPLYNMVGPAHLTAQALPKPLKDIGRDRMTKLASYLKEYKYNPRQVDQINDSIKWVNANDTWEVHSEKFRNETKLIDNVRGEDFVTTFPEFKPWI